MTALFVALYVEALYPLAQVLKESEIVAEAVVERVDAGTKIAFAKVTRSLKGSCELPTLRLNLSAGQDWHPDVIMRHLVVGQPLLIFYNAERRAEAYVNRFFFQLYGDVGVPADKVWWTFTHVEIRMNRTFNGTVAELAEFVARMGAGQPGPAPDPKRPPITRDALRALAPPGEAADERALPPPFARAGVERAPDPRSEKLSYPTHAKGFLRHWLVLAGADAPLDVRPRELERVERDGRVLAWESAEAVDDVLELSGSGPHAVVTYVIAEEELSGLTLLAGSSDGCRLILNGREIHDKAAARSYLADQDRVENVKLEKGLNVLQGRIRGPGALGVRFVDRDGAPLTKIRVSRSPNPER